MWLTIIALILVVLAVCTGAFLYGARQWQKKTCDFRTKLEAGRLPILPATYDVREIEDLPLPVRRYFRAVLKNGQPLGIPRPCCQAKGCAGQRWMTRRHERRLRMERRQSH
jgi:hypothetical protein